MLQGGGIAIFGGNVAIQTSQIYSNIANYVDWRSFEPSPLRNVPFAPMEDISRKLPDCLNRLQGGGIRIYMYDGTVSIISSTISNNQATSVRDAPSLNLPPSPRWSN